MANFFGTIGNDTIIPGTISAGVTTSGTPADLTANDQLFGNNGADLLDGGAGNDNVDGQNGADTLRGGIGNDTLRAGSSSDSGVDDLFGQDGDDFLFELGLGDRAFGDSGDDFFDIDGDGVASLSGGTGIDTLSADGRDISSAVISGIEVLENNATLTGAQLAGFTSVGTDSPTFATTYTYIFTNTGANANFTGKITDTRDNFTLRGVDNALNNDVITFDPNAINRVRMDGYEGNDVLRGGLGRDTIAGDEGADSLFGGGGADQLSAGSVFSLQDAADSLDGGAGADSFSELGLGDTAIGGSGDDLFNVDESGVAVIDGGLGIDTLEADGADLRSTVITGVENLAGNMIGSGAQFSAFSQVGSGSEGAATTYTFIITDGRFANFTNKIAEDNDFYVINGEDGVAVNNLIQFNGTSRNNTRMNGFEGDDRLIGGAGADDLRGDEGSDSLSGGVGADTLRAGTVSSLSDGLDSLQGFDGDDLLLEIGEGDTVRGGEGNDIVNLDEAAPGLLDGGGGTRDLLIADGFDISSALVTGWERLWNNATLTAQQAQQFTRFGAQGESGPNFSFVYTITTGGAALNLGGRLGPDDFFTFNGSAIANNDDVFLLNASDTAQVTFNGNGGNDSLRAGEGFDVLNGGEGNDTLDGGLGANTLNGGNGVDTASFVSLSQGVTVDLTITVYQQTSTASGVTLTSIENLIGSGLGDVLLGANVAETILGGDGGDSIFGRAGSDLLDGGTGNDTIDAGFNNDTVLGGDGNDNLLGQSGNDSLNGGAGDDTLNGGADNDNLTGGAGSDAFLFNPGGGFDTVLDWTDGQDRFQVTGFGAAFDTRAEVLAAAGQIGAGIQITLGSTSVLLAGASLATFTVADIDVV
jgi:Ca2+-binding RTX toxin-like protein